MSTLSTSKRPSLPKNSVKAVGWRGEKEGMSCLNRQPSLAILVVSYRLDERSLYGVADHVRTLPELNHLIDSFSVNDMPTVEQINNC